MSRQHPTVTAPKPTGSNPMNPQPTMTQFGAVSSHRGPTCPMCRAPMTRSQDNRDIWSCSGKVKHTLSAADLVKLTR